MARLLVLDFPEGYEFGIDWMAWQVGEKFAGVGNIPVGYHFIYWSAKEKHGSDCSIRSGKYLHIRSDTDVHVWTWDSDAETCAVLDHTESFQYRENAARGQLDSGLGPYPEEHHQKWVALTTHLNETTIERMTPVQHTVGSGTAWSGNSFYTKLPGRRPVLGPANNKDSSSDAPPLTPSEITKYAFDRTQALSEVLQQRRQDAEHNTALSLEGAMLDLLGELEYSFVAFVVGQSADGLEQWKKLVDMLCRCEDGMSGQAAPNHESIPPQFFEQFLHVLMAQLMEVPEDFFSGSSELSNNNFLKPALSSFVQLLSPEKGELLSELTMGRFAWDITTEEEDVMF